MSCRTPFQPVAMFLCAAILTAAVVRGEPDDSDLQLRFADGLMQRGLHEYAIREYQIFSENNPDYRAMDVIEYRIGECYRHIGNLPAAVRAYGRVVDHEPPSGYRHRAMLRRAEVYRMAGREDVAARLFRELLETSPVPEIRDAALYWLGGSLSAQGQRAEALGIWRDFIERHGDSALAPFVALELGKLLTGGDASEQAEALKWLQSVVDAPPDARNSAEALYHLARLFVEKGDDTRAAEYFDEFWKRHADDARADEARLPTARTYFRAGRYADSLRICIAVIEAGDLDKDREPLNRWYYLKANNERRLGNYATAVDTYAKLLARKPDAALAQAAALEKAQGEFQLGEHARALRSIESVRITHENRLRYLWLHAASNHARDNHQEAIQSYRMIIEQFPESDQAYQATYRLGRLFEDMGNARQASDYYRMTAANHPDRSMAPQALMAAAEQFRSLDRHAEAVRDYSRLLERYPDHKLAADALYFKGISEAHLGRVDVAIRSLTDLLEREPSSRYAADAAYSLGLLYSGAGKHAEADTSFSAALDADPSADLRNRIMFRRAFALQRLGRDAEAAELFEKLLDDPRMKRFDPPLLEWLSRQLRQEQRAKEALNAADMLVERAGNEAVWIQVGHALAGLAATDMGDDSLAKKRLEQALEVDAHTPIAAEAAVTLGELLLAANRVSEALERFRQGEQHTKRVDAPALRARALLGLGACHEAAGEIADANRYYTIVGLAFHLPELSVLGLRKSAEMFDRMGREADRDKILLELEQRFGE